MALVGAGVCVLRANRGVAVPGVSGPVEIVAVKVGVRVRRREDMSESEGSGREFGGGEGCCDCGGDVREAGRRMPATF